MDSDTDASMKWILDSRQEKPKQKGQGELDGDQNKRVENSTSYSNSNEGGSVIVDKINKTLSALLKAWKSWLTSKTPIPPKLLEYPDPLQEKIDLVRHQQLIRDTQTTLEGPLPYHVKQTRPTNPILTPILEAPESEVEEGS